MNIKTRTSTEGVKLSILPWFREGRAAFFNVLGILLRKDKRDGRGIGVSTASEKGYILNLFGVSSLGSSEAYSGFEGCFCDSSDKERIMCHQRENKHPRERN